MLRTAQSGEWEGVVVVVRFISSILELGNSFFGNKNKEIKPKVGLNPLLSLFLQTEKKVFFPSSTLSVCGERMGEDKGS